MHSINKDTLLFGSFSRSAGNFGCRIHNAAFDFYGINAIYKSFSVGSIKQAIEAMITLDIRGVGISMPYKVLCLDFVHEVSEEVNHIGSANTITNLNGVLKAYNTDYFAALQKLSKFPHKDVTILGNGGYAKSVLYAAKLLGKNCLSITRENWTSLHSIKDALIFNCTPVENISKMLDESNSYIDCLIHTNTGKELSLWQASMQFEIYTGKKFPMHLFGDNNE